MGDVVPFTLSPRPAKYTIWRNDNTGSVGFKVTHPDGRMQYVYLNPSYDDCADDANVFVYIGEHGDPGQDAACHYYQIFEEGCSCDARVD